MLKWSLFMNKIILLFLLPILLTGCSVIDRLQSKNFEEIPSGAVLYDETFADLESGWRTSNSNGSYVIYQAEGLHFFVDQSNLDLWSSPGLNFEDVRIEAEAIKIDGPDNNAFGVLCRLQDEKNFYAFVISSDGYAGIYKVADGAYSLLNHKSMEFSSAIRQGEAINYLSATCDGDQLGFSVNGEVLFELKDDQFLSGDVGLMAGSFDDPQVNIFFDNITVFKP